MLENGIGMERIIRYIFDNTHDSKLRTTFKDEIDDIHLGKVNVNIKRKYLLRQIIKCDYIISKKFYINNIKWFDENILRVYIKNIIMRNDVDLNTLDFLFDVNTYENIKIIKNPKQLCDDIKKMVNNNLFHQHPMIHYKI